MTDSQKLTNNNEPLDDLKAYSEELDEEDAEDDFDESDCDDVEDEIDSDADEDETVGKTKSKVKS